MKSNLVLKINMLGSVLAALFIAGCASKSAQTQQGTEKPPASPAFGQQSGGSQSVPGAPVTDCNGQSAPSLNVPGAKKLDGKNLYITVNEQKTSLCDVLRASGKRVAIFQFAGLECITCRAEAKLTQEALVASGKSSDILKVLAFTDKKGDFADADIQRYQAYFPAPALAMRANDYDQSLWYYVNPKKIRPATLIMNVNMEAIAISEFSLEATIVPSAVSLIPKN